MKEHHSPDESSAQWLERAKLTIAKLYQDNKEMQRHLVTKDQEIPLSLGRVGSTVWLQRRLREAQDTIVQLCKAQQVAGEKNIVRGMSRKLGKGLCVGRHNE